MRNIERAREIAKEFRCVLGQSVEPEEPEGKPRNGKKKKEPQLSEYSKFLAKYSALDDDIDGFTPKDMCYFFRKTAEDAGQKYFISFGKDMHIFKMLSVTYTNRDICGMIEFLFTSGQQYLSPDRITPNILVSKWVNTIYHDTQDWLNDRFVPSKPRSKSLKGEWSASSDEVSIGVML